MAFASLIWTRQDIERRDIYDFASERGVRDGNSNMYAGPGKLTCLTAEARGSFWVQGAPTRGIGIYVVMIAT